MSGTVFMVFVVACGVVCFYFVGKLLDTQGPAFRKSEVDGYRLVWYSYGWSGAQAHFQEWNGRKWVTTYRCEPFDSCRSTFEYGHKDKIDALEKKKVKEALAYHASHGQAVHPPKMG
jgi:hypothetical protein